MKRFILTALLVLCFFHAAPVFAKDIVPVRSGVRQAYSRLVFDWKGAVTYEMDQTEKGKVILSFSRAAELDTKNVDLDSLANISNMEVLSTDPLKMGFSIPVSSKARAFTTADKVFFDVYNPINPKEAKILEQPKPVPVEVVAEKPKSEKPLPKDAIAAPPAYVLTPEVIRPDVAIVEPEIKEVSQPEELNAQKTQDGHIISISSTSAVGMAMYENYGEIWFVMDKTGFSMKPNIESPTPEIFGEMQEIEIDGGVAYHITQPENMVANSQGGGLAWQLIFAEQGKIAPNPSIQPIRKTSGMKSMRDGKIIWPMRDSGKILKAKDPLTGQDLIIVTVKDALHNSGEAQSFTDFDVLKSYAGLVIRPKVDDLLVKNTDLGIEISRPDGLAFLSVGIFPKEGHDADNTSAEVSHVTGEVGHGIVKKEVLRPVPSTLFNFSEWKMGDVDDLNRNENLILSTIKDKDGSGQIEDLMQLAKMHLAHGFGPEALGFLDFALQKLPSLKDNSEFRALRGIARAFTYKSEIALTDLLDEKLKDLDEIKIWKSYVLADLGDWKQAADILPARYSVIYSYPDYISNRLSLALAEVYLRAGKKEEAEKLLGVVEHNKESFDESSMAALEYLQGEVFRQRGDLDKTIELWGGLKESKDDLYRTKAQLALTILLKEKKDIDLKESINRLEKLRYAWRGDELEAQTNYWLGKFYFEKRDFLKGLNIMREAAAIASDTDLGKRIAQDMGDMFQSLFLDKGYEDVLAPDAVTVYEQFHNLTPAGDSGNVLVQKLAERLVKADLLERAASLLRDQVNNHLQGDEKIRVAVRLGAIELLDKRPAQALVSLGIAEKSLESVQDTPSKAARLREIALLKARALSQDGKSAEGLQTLEGLAPSSDVNRLKADIAWQKGYWSDAAAALGEVLVEENISPTRPLTEKQAELVMSRAISLSLANDRVELANMRNKYSDLMLQSKKARQFEVITRQHGNAELADKDTLKSIVSEVDLFRDFLESYKQAGQ